MTAPQIETPRLILKKCGMSYWKEIVRNGPRSVFRLLKEDWRSNLSKAMM